MPWYLWGGGWTKYGSFLSSGNFRGIQSIQDPPPRSSSIPDIFYFTFSSSIRNQKKLLFFTDCASVQSSSLLYQSDLTLHAIKRSPAAANLKQLPIVHPICPKKPTNQGEGWPVTKFGHLSFKRVKLGQLFGCYSLLTLSQLMNNLPIACISKYWRAARYECRLCPWWYLHFD